MKEIILRISNLSKSFDNHNVLSALNLNVEAGKLVCILGISGSGKTTLLNLIAGLAKVDSGEISLSNTSIDAIDDKEIRTKYIGIIFQKFHLLEYMNSIDNVIAARNFIVNDRHQNIIKANQLLQQFGLGAELYKFPYQLSGGQKQRVGIARALINEPKLLLADEPCGSLDRKNSEYVMETLCSIVNPERSILFTTHNLDVAKYADEVYILKNKKLEKVKNDVLIEISKIRELYKE